MDVHPNFFQSGSYRPAAKLILSSYLILLTHRTAFPLHIDRFIAAGTGTVDTPTNGFILPLRAATERAGVDEFCLPSLNFGAIGCSTAFVIRVLLRENGAGDKPNEKNGEYRCFLHYLQKLSAVFNIFFSLSFF